MKNSQIQDVYKVRINKAFDYIEKHIDKQFSLAELAEVANFSKFHFNRIFWGVVGETPFQFINRLRLERAASLLCTNPGITITEVAYKVGFSDVSIFSRNFKARFNMSATQYRNLNQTNSKQGQEDSNHQHDEGASYLYFCFESQTLKWRTNMQMNKSVEVKALPEMTVAYIRHIGPYKGDEQLFEKLWNRLFTWAGPRGLVGGKDFDSLIVYHDDPNVTDDSKLRTSVCISVPADTEVSGDVGKMEVEGGNYVVARFEVAPTEFEKAWEWVYGQWLPSSGYQPDDKPCFERYPEEPKNGKFSVDICVPVKPI